MEAWAHLSPDDVYRYSLGREWAEGPQTPETVAWVMLNPSTADATIDDATIRRCIGFSQREGFGRLLVVNLYALRATDPSELARHPDPVGPDNREHIIRAFHDADLIAAAWGAHPMAKRSVLRLRLHELAPATTPVVSLGRTLDGHPCHPCRLPPSRLFSAYKLP